MRVEVQLTNQPIAEKILPPLEVGAIGAWAEFRGVVRAEECNRTISGLDYEAYPEMAEREIQRLLSEISSEHPCLAVKVTHRVGHVPVGEAAIYVGVAAKHRAEAFALLAEFMDCLKRDVPIWKRRAILVEAGEQHSLPKPTHTERHRPQLSLEHAMAEIWAHLQPLPATRVPLADALGRVLREDILAPEDFPSCDRSTRDGYAILRNDPAVEFEIVDRLHAADWRPRQIQPGEAVRVATGAALPCDNLRVVMQEYVELEGKRIRIIKPVDRLNIRRRGEDAKLGTLLLQSGTRLDAGKLALLASAGVAYPLVSPRLRIMHFTTGDEIVPPDQTPKPGQVRDSNSILIRGLLARWESDLIQVHLPEDFERALKAVCGLRTEISNADVVLVSGGASVGDKDFTLPLLEAVGFEPVFTQVNVRPGKPLIFAVNRPQVAFGLPGNPLSHFVCFHFAVTLALARLMGEVAPGFLRARLAKALNDADCPRETLWPGRISPSGLNALPWASSGDVTCFAEANALIRVPANCALLAEGQEVEFFATAGMVGA